MSKMIRVSDALFEQMECAAAEEGRTPQQWIRARLRAEGSAEPAGAPGWPKTAADLFAGRTGLFSSGSGEPRLGALGDAFGEHLERKHREGHL